MWYWNGAGQRYSMPEQAVEDPDCWGPETENEEGEDDEAV